MSPEIKIRHGVQNPKCRKIKLIWPPIAVVIGALLTTWPALYNGYPLLYPDSMTYLADGPLVARALLLHRLSQSYGMRSFVYSLGILPWHWNITPWPIVALQALLTAYVIWLVVRSIVPQRTVTHYLALMVSLSLFTGLSWFVSLVMPDILGPLLYLSIYLLVFTGDTLSGFERLNLSVIAWWAAASHVTHLLLAAGLCAVLAVLLVLRRHSIGEGLRAVGSVAAILFLAATAQVALNAYLYGEPSLNGERPPFLMARVIVDGPGRWYLERHCGQMKLAICKYVHDLPGNADDFLWKPKGIWQSASEEDTEERLREEETPFVLATLRTYPRELLSIAAANFWQQLTTFCLCNLGPSPWVLEVSGQVLPGAQLRYLRSRQWQNTLPHRFFSFVQDWMVVISLVLIGVFSAPVLHRRNPRIVGLSVVIVLVVIANALVTGVLSMVEARFQGRVIWLLPLLAYLFVLQWLDRHHFTFLFNVASETRANS